MTDSLLSRRAHRHGLREAAEIEIERLQARDDLLGSELSTGHFWPILVHLGAREHVGLLSASDLAGEINLPRPLVDRCLQLLREKKLVEVYALASESFACLSVTGRRFMEQLLSPSPLKSRMAHARDAVARRAVRVDNAIGFGSGLAMLLILGRPLIASIRG